MGKNCGQTGNSAKLSPNRNDNSLRHSIGFRKNALTIGQLENFEITHKNNFKIYFKARVLLPLNVYKCCNGMGVVKL